jgi:hypothetical protein
LSRKADITLGRRQGDLGRGRRTRRRQPVGRQPRLHARRLGLRQDGGEGQTRRRRAGLPAQHPRPRHGLGAQPDDRPRRGLSRQPVLSRRAGAAVERAAAAGLSRAGLHGLAEAGNIDTVVEEILDYQVDGIIAASVALSSDLSDRCRAAGVPMVLFNRAQDGEGFSSVTSDNRGRAQAGGAAAGGGMSGSAISRVGGRLDPAGPGAGLHRRGWPRRGARCMPARSATSAWTRPRRPRAACSTGPRRSARRGLRGQRPHGDPGDRHAALRVRACACPRMCRSWATTTCPPPPGPPTA